MTSRKYVHGIHPREGIMEASKGEKKPSPYEVEGLRMEQPTTLESINHIIP